MSFHTLYDWSHYGSMLSIHSFSFRFVKEQNFNKTKPLQVGMFTPSKTSRICRHLSIDLLSSVNDGENVAIKFLNCEKAVEKLRPRQEIELLCNLDHPNILRLVGAYEDSDLFIQVFEFLRQIKYLRMLKHDLFEF